MGQLDDDDEEDFWNIYDPSTVYIQNELSKAYHLLDFCLNNNGINKEFNQSKIV